MQGPAGGEYEDKVVAQLAREKGSYGLALASQQQLPSCTGP